MWTIPSTATKCQQPETHVNVQYMVKVNFQLVAWVELDIKRELQQAPCGALLDGDWSSRGGLHYVGLFACYIKATRESGHPHGYSVTQERESALLSVAPIA